MELSAKINASFYVKSLAICPLCRQKLSCTAGASKQEEDIDNQRVSDGEVEKHGAKGNEKKDVFGEENDPEQTCVLADDTSLRQEMDEKALPEIAIFEKPSSWLEESLNEDQPSTVSHFSVCRSILYLPPLRCTKPNTA